MAGIKGKSGIYERRPFTEEHRANMGKARKNHPCYKNQERNNKISNTLTGRKLSDTHRENLSKSHIGEKHTKQRIINQQNSRRKGGWFIDPERTKEKMRLSRVNIMKNGISQKDTFPEKLVEQYLINNNVKYEKQWKYKYGIADFYLPNSNTVLEVDGVYWHSRPAVKKRDKRQTLFLKKQGYTVKRISDKEILADRIKKMLEVIKNE